jgi:hypothetical protein
MIRLKINSYSSFLVCHSPSYKIRGNYPLVVPNEYASAVSLIAS